jgi:hypothetical protein
VVAKSLDDFLATCRADVFGDRVVEDLRKWKAELERNGLTSVWRRNYRQYHNGSAEAPNASGNNWTGDDAFSIQGESGEILGVRIPESRNLITNALNLTYAKPIGLQGVATSSDPQALESVEIANARMQEAFKAASGGKIMRNCGEMALAVTTGFVDCEWDIFAGEAYIPTENKSMAYTGATKLSERWPDEVRFDLTKKRWDDVWSTTVIQRANRLILASQLPDFADDIMRMPSICDSEFASNRYVDESSDDILILKYVHRPVNSALLPSGRYGLVLEDGTVLRDGDSPYSIVGDGRLGIFPITAASGMGSVYGYPLMNDLSPLQQWLNLVCTMIATLIAGYGAPNLTGPSMMQMDVQQLVGGGRYFGTNSKTNGEVKALQLLPDMKPLFELVQLISSFGEKASGMNTVVRGGAESEMSGKAVALWKSMAVQFMSSFMQSAIEQSESVGNYILRLEEAFASAEQTVAHVGEDNVQQLYRYRASDAFKYVPKVRAEAVDPVMMTPEGREERAWQLNEAGYIQTPQHLVTMIRTGRDEPLYKAPMAHLLLIRRENSRLLKGTPCKVMESDKHEIHIPEHEAIYADPEARENDELMASVAEHIAAHKMFQLGVAPMIGNDPMTGQPYPPIIQQYQEAVAMKAQEEAAMSEEQALAEQEQGGAPQGGGAPKQPARTAQQAMQESAMAVPEEAA